MNNSSKRADSRLRRGKTQDAYQGKKDNRDSELVVGNPSAEVPGTGGFTPLKGEAGITRFARPEGTYSVSSLISVTPPVCGIEGLRKKPPESVPRASQKLQIIRTKPIPNRRKSHLRT